MARPTKASARRCGGWIFDAARPADLAFIEVERLTPLFVLVEKGREIGRIRGYPGEDHFWGLLDALIEKLDTPERVQNAPSYSKNHCTRAGDRF